MVSLIPLYKAPLLRLFSEYTTALKRLGDVNDDHPYTLYSNRKSPVFRVISSLLSNLPTVSSFATSTFFECHLSSFASGILRLFRIAQSY